MPFEKYSSNWKVTGLQWVGKCECSTLHTYRSYLNPPCMYYSYYPSSLLDTLLYIQAPPIQQNLCFPQEMSSISRALINNLTCCLTCLCGCWIAHVILIGWNPLLPYDTFYWMNLIICGWSNIWLLLMDKSFKLNFLCWLLCIDKSIIAGIFY